MLPVHQHEWLVIDLEREAGALVLLEYLHVEVGLVVRDDGQRPTERLKDAPQLRLPAGIGDVLFRSVHWGRTPAYDYSLVPYM